jgi:acyl-CoA hydrolase
MKTTLTTIALIALAAPEFRNGLTAEARRQGLI